jgi:hypothetical protein
MSALTARRKNYLRENRSRFLWLLAGILDGNLNLWIDAVCSNCSTHPSVARLCFASERRRGRYPTIFYNRSNRFLTTQYYLKTGSKLTGPYSLMKDSQSHYPELP